MGKTRIFKSIRTKLFLTLCVIVILIVISLIVLNSFVLGKFYLYNKKESLKNAFETINTYYNNSISQDDINTELEKISIKNDFDIVIKDTDDNNIYISDKDFFTGIFQMLMMEKKI